MQAALWEVKVDGSGDASTIQAAIDSSAHFDVIIVYPGTYLENLNFRGKYIHLKSLAGPQRTVIDGSSLDSTVIVMTSGETRDTILEGFTITGGRGIHKSATARRGGGIYVFGGTPTIRGNLIAGNQVGQGDSGPSWGGGIMIVAPPDGGAASIEENIIEENYAQTNGGGVWIEANCTFSNNLVRANATGTGDGAGVYLTPRKIVVDSNQIRSNKAGDHGGGIYIANSGEYYPSASIIVTKNVIVGNSSNTQITVDCSGAGIWLHGDAIISHNTIAYNKAKSLVPPAVGGICIRSVIGSATIERNIIAHNSGGSVGVYQCAGDITIRQNLFENGGSLLPLASAEEVILEDNVFGDPMFCLPGPESDGGIAGISPALNQSFGVIGAITRSSCGPSISTKVMPVSWGKIKAMYVSK